jgi:hypothetical protein
VLADRREVPRGCRGVYRPGGSRPAEAGAVNPGAVVVENHRLGGNSLQATARSASMESPSRDRAASCRHVRARYPVLGPPKMPSPASMGLRWCDAGRCSQRWVG